MSTKYVDKFMVGGEDIFIKDGTLDSRFSEFEDEQDKKFDNYTDTFDNKLLARFNRNLLVVADSYGDTYYSGDLSAPMTFIDYLRNIIPNHWTLVSKVQSGASFLGLDNNATLKFEYLIRNTGISESNRNKITDIVVVGGWNDVDNLTTHGKTILQLQTAIKDFTTACAELFPNATVLLCPVGTSMFNTTQRQGYINMLNCYCNPADANGKFTCMSDADCILTDTTMFRANQWVHPNNKGGRAIANAILSTIFGQGISVHRWWTNSVNGAYGNMNGVVESINPNINTLSSGFYQYQNGRNIELLILQTAIQMTTSLTWSGTPDDMKKICTLKDPIFVGSQFYDFQTTIPLNVKTSNNVWLNTTGIIGMFGKDVRMSVVNVGDAGWEDISVNWVGFTGNISIRGDAGLCNL